MRGDVTDRATCRQWSPPHASDFIDRIFSHTVHVYFARTIAILLLCLWGSSQCAAQPTDAQARTLRLRGRYEEAIELYSQRRQSTASVVGHARCLAALGQTDAAIAKLKAFVAENSGPKASVTLAWLYFQTGKYADAKRLLKSSLNEQPSSVLGQFLTAELKRTSGDFAGAKEAYGPLAKTTINDLQVDDALLVCRAIATHGRWTQNTRVFDRLVNDLYPRLLNKNPNFWPAHLDSGKLFLEKFNDADALRELKAAIAINPRAAEAHVQLGRLALRGFQLESATAHLKRALSINEHLVSALQLSADIALVNLLPSDAVAPLEKAVSINSVDEATLGRQLAVHLRLDGLDSANKPNARASQLIKAVEARNPRCGAFFAAAGDAFNAMRIYPLAAAYYKRALDRFPEQVAAKSSLGMVQMRLGEEADARRTLEDSFKADPFNVRVKNTLDVLDLLDTYAVLETEHFVLRFNRGQDGLLAEYAARMLEEEVYPDLVAELGYEPKGKTLLEIFSKANGTSGHAWFSARMVGLPFIGTVGACAGKMFALTSPADGQAYNWARVLRHEFVHVLNLQQTNFLIPHWFTEAIAVRNENIPYPADWERILAKYVANDSLFTLADINHGFVRPDNSERWTLAYYQAYLYADFCIKLAGDDAIPDMLSLYAEGNDTADVVKAVTGLDLTEFEAQYRAFLAERTKDFGVPRQQPVSADELQARLTKADTKHKKAELLGLLAEAQLRNRQTRKASRFAQQAIELDQQQPDARYVLARLMSSVGDDAKAWSHIQQALKAKPPNAKLLAFAATLKQAAGEYDAAIKLYKSGQDAFPSDMSWTKGLARVYLKSGESTQLMTTLSQIAEREADKTPFAKKLTLLALANKDYKTAEKWANRVLHVDVMNPIAHAQLGKALARQGKRKSAIREYETALRLSPGDANWRQELDQLKLKERAIND